MNTPIPSNLPTNIPVPLLEKEPSAPSMLIYGRPGAGKTRLISTLADAGLDVFVVVTEPNGTDSLIDAIRAVPARGPHIFWTEVAPKAQSWGQFDAMVKTIGDLSYAAIADLKGGVGKEHRGAFERLILCFKNFIDDRSGRSFGDVTTWGSDRALVIDSLSGLNKLAREQTVGAKPSMHQGEWGIAMELEGALIYKLCMEVRAFFLLIAHADRVADELTGATELSVAALGNKLAPQLVKYFSEVLFMKQEKGQYVLSSAEAGSWTKSRTFGPSDKIPPSLEPIVLRHRERLAALGG